LRELEETASIEMDSERSLPCPKIEMADPASHKRAWPKAAPGNPVNYTRKVLITITKSPTKKRKTESSPINSGTMAQLDLIPRRRTESTYKMKTLNPGLLEVSTSNHNLTKHISIGSANTKNRPSGPGLDEKNPRLTTNYGSPSKSPVKAIARYTIVNGSKSPQKMPVRNIGRAHEKEYRIRADCENIRSHRQSLTVFELDHSQTEGVKKADTLKNTGGTCGQREIEGISPIRALIAKTKDIKNGVMIVDEG
jgi:hypothetical protein